jgi:hypothetical protein
MVQKTPVAVGRRGSEHAGKIVALYEDVHDMGGTYVEFPLNSFHAFAVSVRVPTLAAIDVLVNSMAAEAHYLGPYPDYAPDTEIIRVRVCVWAPPKYVPLILGARLTPREAWTTLAGAIIADGNQVQCSDLLDYLRAALIAEDGGSNVGWERPPVLHTDEPMRHRFAARINAELPGRDTARVTAESQSSLLARQLEAFDRRTVSMSRDTTTAIQAQREPKTPSRKYATMISSIYKRMGGDDDQCLPDLYYNMAKAEKGGTRSTIQQALAARASSPDSLADAAPFVSPAVDRKWQGQQRHAPDKRSIDLVITLADFPMLTPEQRADVEALGNLSDAMQGEHYSPSPEAQARINEGCKIGLPFEVLALIIQCKTDSLFKDVDLGPETDKAKEYRVFIKGLESRITSILTLSATKTHFIPRLACAIIYRWHAWYAACDRLPNPIDEGCSPLPAGPNWNQLLENIDSEEWEPPQLPPRFLPAPVLPAAVPPPTPGPPAPGGPAVPPARADGRRNGDPDPNDFGRTAMLCLQANGSPMRMVDMLSKAGTAPPKRADNQQMCLAFWCHKRCNVGCRREYDHLDDQPPAIITKREEWCQKARGE